MWLIYVTGVLGGFNIGGIFAVDRVFMTRLSPETPWRVLWFVFNNWKVRYNIRSIIWGFIVDGLNLGRNVAMGSLILLLISFYIISGVSDNKNY